MAFNDHPYKTIKLDNNGSIKEYSQINVNGVPVWRKPISYTKKLYITDASGTIKSYDAVEDEGIEFHLYKLINGNWIECLSPEDNDDLNNQVIIKYGDILKYTYTLGNGYTLRQNSSKMGSTDLIVNQQFTVLNDFSIDLRVRPLKYDLIITGAHGHLFYMSHLYGGRVREIQDDPAPIMGVPTGEDVLYYGDTLSLRFTTDSGWKYVSSSGYTSNMTVTDDVNIDIVTRPLKCKLHISTSAYGIASGGFIRTAGAIAQEIGISSGAINDGDYVYYGDSLDSNAVPETGYTLRIMMVGLTPAVFENERDLPVSIEAIPILYTLTINRTGETINPVDNSLTITNISINRQVGTIATREGYSNGNIYNGEVTNNDEYVQVYYGDILTISYTVQAPYKSLAQQVITAPAEDFSTTVNLEVKNFTVSIVQNTGVASLTVTRTSSPYQEASTGVLSDGDTIYYGDTITVEAVASDGYTLNSYTQSITVIGNTVISPTTSVNLHHFYVNNTAGVNRVFIALITPGINPERSAGVLYDGDCLNDSTIPYCDIYYGEKLQALYYPSTGYYYIRGKYVDVLDEDITDIASTTPVERKFYILGKEGITGVKITCLSAGIGPHTVNEVLYDGNVKIDANSYCTVYYNEVIKVEYYIHEAYNSLSSDTITIPDDNKTITKNSTVKTFTLTSSKNTGVSSLVIKRTYRRYPSASSEQVVLNNGDSYNYGDTITVSANPNLGYLMDSYTTEYTNVTSDLTISPTAHKIYGTLAISKDVGVNSVIVMRNNIQLSDGARLYYGDIIIVNASAKAGYTLNYYTRDYTFNPSVDGTTLTVSITSYPTAYTLHLTVDSNSIDSYTVERIMAGVNPDAPLIDLVDGDTIYYGDRLNIEYRAKTNYVLDTGYNTYRQYNKVCGNSDETISLSGTYTEPVIIGQYGKGNTSLDNEDTLTLKVRYPDNPDTPVNYDSTKRIRVDQKAKFYPSDQTFTSNIISIYKLEELRSGALYTIGLIDYDYYELEAGTFRLHLNPRVITLSVKFVSNTVKYINPELSTLSFNRGSKYGNNESQSIHSSAYDYNYHSSGQTYILNYNFYYKDEIIGIGYNMCTGWTWKNAYVDSSSGGTTYQNADDIDFTLTSQNYVITVNRDIIYYTIKYEIFYYCIYSLWLDYTEILTDEIVNPNIYGEFQAPYGSRFKKELSPLPYNDPMLLRVADYQNDTYYLIRGAMTIRDGYLPNLEAPTISESHTLYLNQYNEEEIRIRLMVTNPNNVAGNPYTVSVRLYKDSQWEDHEYSIDGGGVTNYYDYRISLGENPSSYPHIKITAYFKAKTVYNVNRTKSYSNSVEFDASPEGGQDDTETET